MPLDNAAPKTSGAAWRVEMLGGLRALPLPSGTDGGKPAEPLDPVESVEPVEQFRTHKTALLLARLALSPTRAHGRDELVDMLWPDAPADRGRANLTQTLVYLRQALGEPRTGGLFVSNHKTVRVVPALLETDVAVWEADANRALHSGGDEQADLLRLALDGYRGPLLPGMYDDWVCDERNRLDALREALAERLRLLPSRPSLPVSPQTPVIRNAPLLLTRFFGRDAEGKRAGRVLTEEPPVRLLTLLGMGGIGKTRFALRLAASVVCPDTDPAVFGGAVFVPLAEARTAAHMEGILRDVLGVPDGGAAGMGAVTSHLCAEAMRIGGRFLLILDNLEQLGETAAPVVARLLGDVPALTILATSRQPVGIAGEQEMALGPLPTVSENQEETGGTAVQLFVDRARLVRPDFALTPETDASVTPLCALLEGVPLALELAAAWVRVLTTDQIVARLHNRFGLLTLAGTSAGGGSVPKRHRSLHAAIAWSYDLLGPSLQTFFAQLSVFQGGWTAAAAQAVTGINEVSEPLLLLAERSLILAEANDETGDIRYRMLESLREFAHEQAVGLGEDNYAALWVRKATYFEALTREANALVETGRGMRHARRLLERERDNLRSLFASLRDLNVNSDDTVSPAGVRSVITCLLESQWLWPVNELRQWLCLAAEAAVLLPGETKGSVRASVLSQHGVAALYAGDYKAAERFLCESLTLWEAVGNREQFFVTQKRLASIAARAGDSDRAVCLLMECLQFARETSNPYGEAGILNNLANEGQDLVQRREWIEQAVALDRKHSPGSHFLACSLNSFGGIASEQGDWTVARACLEEAHDIAVADGAAGMMGITKMSLAQFLSERGEPSRRPRELLQEAQTLFEEKEEPLRVAQIHMIRFGIALRDGDPNRAVMDARAYLCLNRDASLMDRDALAAAGSDLAARLGAAGYESYGSPAALFCGKWADTAQ